MSTILLIAALGVVGIKGSPISIKDDLPLSTYGGSDGSISQDFSGGYGLLGGQGLGGLQGHAALSLAAGGGSYGGGQGSYGGGQSSYDVSGGHEAGGLGPSDLGDYHKGVSIIAGGEGHGASFDLTNHGGPGHSGAFGGTLIGSAKYEGEGGQVAHKLSGGSDYVTYDQGQYTDVLSAGHDGLGSLGGGGGDGYKWAFAPSQTSSLGEPIY